MEDHLAVSLLAVTREVSPSIDHCELSFQTRDWIDLTRAIAQHQDYEQCLSDLGARVVSLTAEPELPDAVFVEDAALVLDEVAVITNMGAASRRPESKSIAATLANYRPLTFLADPATLDGGDVLRAERSIFVGVSRRTSRDAIAQLDALLQSYEYQVTPVAVTDCLHLKSACSYLGNNRILLNRSLIDWQPLRQFELIDVAEEEPAAANILLLNDQVIMPTAFPRTQALLEARGFSVRAIDVSELQKAEGGVTCCSLIFRV
ncbi:MAG TPA: arginine deiminase family protein [Chthoniobacterales bacterium]